MAKFKSNINKYIISFLIFSITLFGIFSFIVDKEIIDNLLNYYVIIASGAAILILFINNIKEFKWNKLKKISLFIIVITILWIAITPLMGIRLNIEALKGLVNYACLLILGYAISNIALNDGDKKYILNSIYISCFICIAIGIWQYFSGVNLITYSNDLYPGILGRINSTFYIATILDKYLVLIAVLLMYSLIKSPKKKLLKILYILVGIGICLTFSRSGQLIFLFVSGIFFLISLFKKQLLNIATILITILIMLFIPGTTTSLQSGLDFVYEKINLPETLRVDITFIDKFVDNILGNLPPNENIVKGEDDNTNEEVNEPIKQEPIENQSMNYRDFYKNIGLQLIEEYPIFGIGVGNYSYLVNNQNFRDYLKDDSVLEFSHYYMYPHNNTIQVAAEIGYIGLILVFLNILSFSCYINFKKDKMLILTLFMLIVCLLLSGYTEGVFNSKQYIFIFIIIYSFLCCKNKKEQKSNDESQMLKLFEKTYKGSKKEYFNELEKNIKNNKKNFIVTANPEAFMIASQKEEYMNLLLNQNTTIVPDGIGIVKAGKMLGFSFKERIPGVEIAEYLLRLADKYKRKVYLFGAEEEIVCKMKKMIEEKYSKAKIVGIQNGYAKDKEEVFEDIAAKQPDIILVALGMPLQEELIYKNINKFKKGIFVGVGGSFDVLSGSKKRAPKIFIKLNLEWLYRIAKEPKRIKRFWNNNITFLQKIRKIGIAKND